jgi:hypothetical protein
MQKTTEFKWPRERAMSLAGVSGGRDPCWGKPLGVSQLPDFGKGFRRAGGTISVADVPGQHLGFRGVDPLFALPHALAGTTLDYHTASLSPDAVTA